MTQQQHEGITLRGHHLICLCFFSGEGYSSEFVENLSNVLRRAESGEPVEVCEGADDVCNACPSLWERRCRHSENSEEETREMDRAALGLLRIRSGGKVSWQEMKERIPEIFSSWAGRFCRGCDWLAVCRKNRVFSRLLDEKAQSEF